MGDTAAGEPAEADVERWIGAGDWPAVERAGERLVAAAPGRGAGWYFLGLARLKQGRTEEGIASLRRGADVEPDLGELQRVLGVALIAAHEFTEAVPILIRAGRLEPGPDADLPLAYAYCCLGRVQEAKEVLARIDPGTDPELARKHAEIARLAGGSHFAGMPGELVVAGLVALRATFGGDLDGSLRALGLGYGVFAVAYVFVARKPGPKVVRPMRGPLDAVTWLAQQAIGGVIGVTYLPLTVAWWSARRWLGWFGGVRPPAPTPAEADKTRIPVGSAGAVRSTERPAGGASDSDPGDRGAATPTPWECPYAGVARVRTGSVVLDGRAFGEGEVLLTIDRTGHVRLGDAAWGDPWGFVSPDGTLYEGRLPEGVGAADAATAWVFGRRSDLRVIGDTISAPAEGLVADLHR